MAKRLSEKQKEEIILSFSQGKTINFLSERFNCTNSTIIRNLKKHFGEIKYSELIDKGNFSKKIPAKNQIQNNNKLESDSEPKFKNENDFLPNSSFIELAPLDYQIDSESRKELSSVDITEIDFPNIVYMVVDKKIELEIKLLKDYPQWQFLPLDDLNRKTLEIFYDLKIAKRFCSKDQKVIKIPNPNVFRIVSHILISRGISRIVSSDKLIAL